MDINNLTVVEKLMLNAMRWLYYKQDPNRVNFLNNMFALFWLDDHQTVLNQDYRRNRYIKSDAWIHKRAYENVCRELAWPSVKLKQYGYTREKALAEARGVIEFVKRRYEEIG